MPLYKATKIVLVLKKGGKNPIPCLFIIEGNNYSNLTNQSSVCCARLQKQLLFSNLPLSRRLSQSLYIQRAKIHSILTNQSSVCCASLQELLQLLVLPVSKQCSLSLYIRDLYKKEHIEISSCFSLNEISVLRANLQKQLQFTI